MLRCWVNKRFEFSADKQWLSGTRRAEQLCCLQLDTVRDATVILTLVIMVVLGGPNVFWGGTWFKKHEKHWFKSRVVLPCWKVMCILCASKAGIKACCLWREGHGTCLIHDKIHVPKLKHRQPCKSCAWLKILLSRPYRRCLYKQYFKQFVRFLTPVRQRHFFWANWVNGIELLQSAPGRFPVSVLSESTARWRRTLTGITHTKAHPEWIIRWPSVDTVP